MFGVWYSDQSTCGREIVSGLANDWTTAQLLAKRLYTIRRKLDGIDAVSTGIFFFKSGELYTGRIPDRWQIMPLLTSNT